MRKLLAAVFLLAIPASAQVVERGRTFADLTASHPCSSGLTERIARVTDCDAADDVGDGGGAFQCWVRCDGTAPWETVAIGGGGGGGEATAVQGSDTIPATCAEKDLYQDTNSGGTEFYVCTATNTWTKTAPQTSTQTLTTGHLLAGAANTYNIGSLSGSDRFFNLYLAGDLAEVSAIGNSSGNFWVRTGTDVRLGPIPILWSGVNAGVGPMDVGLTREAAGVLRLSDASSGLGWFYEDGKKALAANFTNATATMANITGLTVTLKASRLYTFESAFYFSDSTAGEGAAFDFDGGAATATNFVANCQMFDAALLLSAESTALATDFAAATTTGASVLRCSGSFEVNAAGTFIPRAAQNSHSSGTLTVRRGSYLNVTDASFN